MEPKMVVFTAAEAGRILKFSRTKMYKLLEDGEVPHARKLGGSWRIASRGVYSLFDEPWPQGKESAREVSPGADRTQS